MKIYTKTAKLYFPKTVILQNIQMHKYLLLQYLSEHNNNNNIPYQAIQHSQAEVVQVEVQNHY